MQLKKEIKFETLRKSHKKQIIIGSVLVCVIGSILTFNLTKAKYRLTQSMKLVTGTINYKVPDMRVVAVNISEDGTNYEIVDDIPESGYTLNEEKSICKVATETSGIENAPRDNNISIKYENNKISFYGITKRNTRCYLYFDKYVEPTSDDTVASLGIDESKITQQTSTIPDFSKVAKTDEGIYRTEDGMYGGASYYWRGSATTNHIIFADKCWRIVRINGDGTIRLIYNGTVQSNNTCIGNGRNTSTTAITNQAYNVNNNRSEYAGYTYTIGSQRPTDNINATESNLKAQTDKWYNDNIGNNIIYDSKVASGRFCNDRKAGIGYTWSSQPSDVFNYAIQERIQASKHPTLNCTKEDEYIIKAGAITADEVSMAGGVYGGINTSYYLYNGSYYWTMTPFRWIYNSTSDRRVTVLYMLTNGSFAAANVDLSHGIRPVINLRSDVTFNSGSDGTQNNPYIVQ